MKARVAGGIRTHDLRLKCMDSEPAVDLCFVSRRRWESNPLQAALQAAATPCDFSVINPVSSPRFEPGLRPSQGRVHPSHSGDIRHQHPAEESNLARLLRRQSCVLHTRRAFTQCPNQDSNLGLDLRRVECNPLHHRDRADDWIRTSMNPATRRAPFSVEPRRQLSTSVRIRTPSGGFGDRMLSQEHTRIEQGCSNGIEPSPSDSQTDMQRPLHHEHHVFPDQDSNLEQLGRSDG